MSFTRHDSKVYHWPDGIAVRVTIDRLWDVQSPPYVNVLDFSYIGQQTVWAKGYNAFDPDFTYYPGPLRFDGENRTEYAMNKAIESFYSQVGDQSSWGTNLAEAEQSVSTVERRGLQLFKFASALRKGNFSQAAKILEIGKPKNLKSGAKTFANNFLEYHFGWEPAMQDIHDALDTMGKADFGVRKIVGHGSGRDTQHTRADLGDRITTFDQNWHFTAKVGANIQISNDVTFLASQLGLANPASVAWDLVPYSFVVDWFTNVGSVLQSVTGLIGLDVKQKYTVLVQEGYRTDSSQAKDGSIAVSAGYKNILIDRGEGIPIETLVLKPFKGFSPIRGLTAISLLLQKL
jgi:hypothetical protein